MSDRIYTVLKKPVVQDTLLLVVVGVLSIFWFGNQQLLWGDDASFPLNLGVLFNRYFHVWSSNSGFADVLKLPTIIPVNLFLTLYGLVGLPFSVAVYERVLLITLVSGSAISMSQLLRSVGVKSRLAIMLSSIFYAYNFFSMLIIWFPLANIMFEYAFFPLLLSRFITAFNEHKSFRYALSTALIWTLLLSPGYGTITLLITDLAILTGYLLFYLVINRLRGVVYSIKFFMLTLISWAAINTFWLFPVFTHFANTTAYSAVSANLSIFETGSVKLLDAIRLSGYWGLTSGYRGAQYYPWYSLFDTIPFVLLGFIPFLLAVLGYHFNRRSANAKFFAVLLVVSLVLVNGSNEPFGRINLWLFSNPLIKSAFRSLYQRFTEYIVLGYSVLIGLFWAQKPKILSLSKINKIYHKLHFECILTIFLIALLSGAYLWPLWTGKIFEQNGILVSKRTTFPAAYYDVAEWFSTKEGEFNILPLPYPSSTSSTYLWWGNGSEGYDGLYPLLLLSDKKFMVQNEIGTMLSSGIMNGSITDSAVLTLFNVKYILVHRDTNVQFVQGNPNLIFSPLNQISGYLENMSGLVLEKSFDDLDIYTNTKYEPNEFFSSYALPLGNASTSFLLNEMGGGYTHKIPILFNSTSFPSIFQVRVLYYSGMKGDFSDLKFTIDRSVDQSTGNELTLPFWIEQFEPNRSATVWIRVSSGSIGMNKINMYYGSISQPSSQNGSQVFDFFDDFGNGFGAWSEIGSNWKIDTSNGVYQNQSAFASGASSALVVDTTMTKGFFCGWFRFGENTENHYPFLPNDDHGGWNYWVVAGATGEFGWFNGTAYASYPDNLSYYPDCWYLIKVDFDLTQSRFWVTVNGTLLTPDGLQTLDAEGQLASKLINCRILNAAGGRNATLWLGATWIGNSIAVDPIVSMGEPTDIATSVEKIPSIDSINYDVFGLKLDASTSFYVILNEPYDSNWELGLNASNMISPEHFQLFGLVNAWFVPAGGRLDITVTYLPQDQMNSLYVFSILAFFLIFVAIICWNKTENIRKVFQRIPHGL